MAVAQSEEETSSAGAEPQTQGPLSAADRHAARRAAKAAKKASKKGTDLVPDEVQERVDAAAAAYERSSGKLWALLAGFVALSAAGFGIKHLVETQDHSAAAALTTGIEAATAPIVKAGEQAPEGDDRETFTSASERATKAKQAFEAAASQHSGKLAARWAQLGAATAQLELGQYAEAEKSLTALGSDADPFLAARATEGLGIALEAQNKHAEAAARYEALAKIDGGAYKPLGDYHRARMLVAQQKPRDAATLLEALIKAERAKPEAEPTRFPNVVEQAETLLTELSVELDDPKLRAEIPRSRASDSGGSSGNIMDALRMQLGQGEGDSQLSPELLKMLQNLQTGEPGQPAAP